MGKKRRIIARATKFGAKYANHPASGGTTTVTPVDTTSNSDRINAIAEKIETIEREVVAAQEETETVVSNAPTPAPVETQPATPKVKAAAPTKRATKARKTRTTSKTSKK